MNKIKSHKPVKFNQFDSFKNIIEGLERNYQSIKVDGFGTFSIREYKITERILTAPNGNKNHINARIIKRLTFKPSETIRKLIN
jgi:nucleoid DNA-binding protein